jgi:hypothetical protein
MFFCPLTSSLLEVALYYTLILLYHSQMLYLQWNHLLQLIAQHQGPTKAKSICEIQLRVLTCTTGLYVPATQHELVWNWIILIDDLHMAMLDLTSLWKGYGYRKNVSQIPQIPLSLSPLLHAKLLKEFLDSHSIMSLPPSANTLRVSGQKAVFISTE